MKSEELATIVEKNMNKIQVGALFATERQLYSALSIPKDSDAKMTRNVVSGYFTWEKTRRLNKNNKISKEISITKVDNCFHYTDGRKNNGGAHNNTYGPIIKSALMNYEYGKFITHRQIDEKIYGFKEYGLESDFRKNDRHDPDNKHEVRYKEHLSNYLKSITETALDGLQAEGLIEWKKIYVITGNVNILKDYSIELDENTLLTELLDKIYGKEKQDEFEEKINKSPKDSQNYISLSGLTVMKFLDICTKNSSPFNTAAIKTLWNFGNKSMVATEAEAKIISNMEEAVCGHLGFTRQAMALNSYKRSRVYKRTGIIYNLLGWGTVWKALQVDVLNRQEGETKYPKNNFSHAALLKALEPYMIKWVTVRNSYNSYEAGRKKRETRSPAFGRWSTVIVGTDEDYPYLAKDPKINILHCNIFRHLRDDKFFEQYLQVPPEENLE